MASSRGELHEALQNEPRALAALCSQNTTPLDVKISNTMKPNAPLVSGLIGL